ncbi:MAG: 16S rRNA (uracil(1498)-N(3))-methyltransferase, partial [Wenzhouxiangellaceae bacterium]
MRTTRIFTGQEIEAGREITLEARAAHHVVRVLRCRRGDRLVLFNGHGGQAEAEIISAHRQHGCRVRILELFEQQTESPLWIELVQAISRGDKMDRVVRQAVELGVGAIRPLVTRRCEVRPDEFDRRLTRWREIVIGACEQSGRNRIPEVHVPVTPDELVCRAEFRWVLVPGAERALAATGDAQGGIAIVIGPEGGLADEELEVLSAQGFQPRHLGPRILRTETAGPAAIAIVQATSGDLGEKNL